MSLRLLSTVGPRRLFNAGVASRILCISTAQPRVPVLAASGAALAGASDSIRDGEHERYMEAAIEQAQLAYSRGEVPVGAILVGPDGDIISRAYNKTETDADPTAHAEMGCLRQATCMSGGWRLLDCTMYVTLEPCPMCAGAILQARVGTVVYGARNTLLGADGSWIRMFDRERPHPFHPSVRIIRGVREEPCSRLMKEFFRERRRKE